MPRRESSICPTLLFSTARDISESLIPSRLLCPHSTRCRDDRQEVEETLGFRCFKDVGAAAFFDFAVDHEDDLIGGVTGEAQQVGDDEDADILTA